ncbi:cyclase family protein [Fodinisporobacter ferrooxydans]|uniref:Cyclase family protein n=1 Tax=Fodinisporobacter ferrooxydans TaxID=2901836 RepID=A0ABY4CN90_9BACL|nr:cyclase family protein [Alicyclobacillaceae bacterium MYW30-H2]
MWGEINMSSLATLSSIFSNSKVVDLTVLLENGIPRWPSHPHLIIDPTVNHEHDGYYCQSISMPEHCGTHVDAPHHVHADLSSLTIEQVKPDALIGTCTVIDLSDREWKPGERATLADIQQALNKSGVQIEEQDIVLLNFGWLKKYWSKGIQWKYYATNQPGLAEDVAEYMIQKKIKAFGTDTIAVGTPVNNGKEEYCYFHQRVLRKEIYLMECLVNLEQLPAKCFFIATPLKIDRGSGSPIRALAFVPQK